MAKRLAGPIQWFGGKFRLVSKLLPLIPTHTTYVEVFAGGASLFFAKPTSPLEVINDLDSGLVNFYRVLRDPDKFERFRFLVALTPFSREEYLSFRDTWKEPEDDVVRAHRWFVVARQCFGGMFGTGFGTCVTTGKNGTASSVAGYLSAIDRLPEISARLMRVQIEHKDCREIIKQYDRAKTFFYLDPPYVSDTRKSRKVYEHEMSNKDHEELIETLLNIQGKAMISGYAHPIYEPLEKAGWSRYDFEAVCSVPTRFAKEHGAETRKRIETVWIRS